MLHRNRGAEGWDPMAIGEFGDAPAAPDDGGDPRAMGECGAPPAARDDGGLVLWGPMYWFWEMTRAALHPARAAADMTRLYFKTPMNPFANTLFGKSVAATCELFERSTRH